MQGVMNLLKKLRSSVPISIVSRHQSLAVEQFMDIDLGLLSIQKPKSFLKQTPQGTYFPATPSSMAEGQSAAWPLCPIYFSELSSLFYMGFLVKV